MKSTLKKPSPYGATKFSTIDEYHASFPKNTRDILQKFRQTIKQIVPQATETISYNIPTFKLDKNLVHYAAFKEHIGFYPSTSPMEIFKEELKAYKTSKGAIQFPIDQPLPIALIKKIVKFRLDEEKKKTKPKKSAVKDHQ